MAVTFLAVLLLSPIRATSNLSGKPIDHRGERETVRALMMNLAMNVGTKRT